MKIVEETEAHLELLDSSPKIKACEKIFRRYLTDIPRAKFSHITQTLAKGQLIKNSLKKWQCGSRNYLSFLPLNTGKRSKE